VEKLMTQRKKLAEEESDVDKKILLLHQQMTQLQSDLSAALGRVQRIRKVRGRIESKARQEIQRGLQELDEEEQSSSDQVLSFLEASERHTLEEVQFSGVTPETDLNLLGLGEDFSDLTPLFPSGGTGESGVGTSSGV
jgi:hypothetical protein